LGRSRGGFSTKLHAVVDPTARPLHVVITPGQQHESTVAEELMDHATGGAFIGDTGYDSVRILDEARYRDMRPVIPGHPRRKRKRRIDRGLYGLRYLVEVFFHNLKRFVLWL